MHRVPGVLKIVVLVCSLAWAYTNPIQAQSSSLDSYSTGDGMVIRNPITGYRMQIRAYTQFMAESRRFNGVDETYNRFRARRMVMRIVGSSPSDKLRYRVQFDFAQSLEGDDEVRGMLLEGWESKALQSPLDLSGLVMGCYFLRFENATERCLIRILI